MGKEQAYKVPVSTEGSAKNGKQFLAATTTFGNGAEEEWSIHITTRAYNSHNSEI